MLVWNECKVCFKTITEPEEYRKACDELDEFNNHDCTASAEDGCNVCHQHGYGI